LSLFSVNHNFRTPYFYNYSLQVEKSVGSKAVFQIGYVGSEGRKLSVVSNINQGNAISSHFGTILQLSSVGTSNYNSLQSTFRIRDWHGLTSQFAYTWDMLWMRIASTAGSSWMTPSTGIWTMATAISTRDTLLPQVLRTPCRRRSGPRDGQVTS